MEAEKIICCDRGDDNALAAAILAQNNRRDDSMWPLAMMGGGGMNNWMNNPFAYMMMMAFLRNGGFGGGYGDGGAQGIELNAQIQSLRSQLQDNQNSGLLMGAIQGNKFDLSQLAQNLNVNSNLLQKAVCEVQAQIQMVAGQVGFSAERVINAGLLGDANITAALKDCCCRTNENITSLRGDIQLQMCQQTGTLRDGQRDISSIVTQGFSASTFQAQQDKCDILRAGELNTQRIIDTLNNHWTAEKDLKIQQLEGRIAQFETVDAVVKRLGGDGCGCSGRSFGGF